MRDLETFFKMVIEIGSPVKIHEKITKEVSFKLRAGVSSNTLFHRDNVYNQCQSD